MPQKPTRNKTAATLQAHMDAMVGLTEQTGDNIPLPPARYRGEAEHICSLLSEIRQLLTSTTLSTSDLLDQCRAHGLTNAVYANSQEYWTQLASSIVELEHLLWVYCDESWFNRSSAMEKLAKQNKSNATQIEIRTSQDHVVIRMPHIPAIKNRKFTLAEDLLWTKILSCPDLPSWESCHVSFCHVYPQAAAHLAKDIDNYDYKRTIDILSYAFGFSDCPETFSMSMESMVTDTIHAGTYIRIEPNSSKKFATQLLSEFEAIEKRTLKRHNKSK